MFIYIYVYIYIRIVHNMAAVVRRKKFKKNLGPQRMPLAKKIFRLPFWTRAIYSPNPSHVLAKRPSTYRLLVKFTYLFYE
jgi:hypothetical protein